jgi:capsule polysaccharide export protein KpsE/RkpR
MEKLRDKIEKIWSVLLNQKSKNYLLRSKIDQSIAITNANLSASFLGNRQMANHNTDDIQYCLNKIIEKNSTEPDVTKLSVDLIFLKHRQKLNKRLVENSKILIGAIEQLQLAHQRVMKTNEEIVKFNTNILETTSEIISENELPVQLRLGVSEIQSELEKIEKDCLTSDKTTQKLIDQIEDICKKNDSLSEELDKKREKIVKNRDRISGVRADLSIWTK